MMVILDMVNRLLMRMSIKINVIFMGEVVCCLIGM